MMRQIKGKLRASAFPALIGLIICAIRAEQKQSEEIM